MGNGEWGMGNGEWGMGNGDLKRGKGVSQTIDTHRNAPSSEGIVGCLLLLKQGCPGLVQV